MHRSHLVMVRKMSWFGLNCLFLLYYISIYLFFVATNPVGNCPEVSLNRLGGVTFTDVEIQWSFIKNIQWCQINKC